MLRLYWPLALVNDSARVTHWLKSRTTILMPASGAPPASVTVPAMLLAAERLPRPLVSSSLVCAAAVKLVTRALEVPLGATLLTWTATSSLSARTCKGCRVWMLPPPACSCCRTSVFATWVAGSTSWMEKSVTKRSRAPVVPVARTTKRGLGINVAGTLSVKEPSAPVTAAAISGPTWFPALLISMIFTVGPATRCVPGRGGPALRPNNSAKKRWSPVGALKASAPPGAETFPLSGVVGAALAPPPPPPPLHPASITTRAVTPTAQQPRSVVGLHVLILKSRTRFPLSQDTHTAGA